eukprot:6268373-Amphidinium_carterae.1
MANIEAKRGLDIWVSRDFKVLEGRVLAMEVIWECAAHNLAADHLLRNGSELAERVYAQVGRHSGVGTAPVSKGVGRHRGTCRRPPGWLLELAGLKEAYRAVPLCGDSPGLHARLVGRPKRAHRECHLGNSWKLGAGHALKSWVKDVAALVLYSGESCRLHVLPGLARCQVRCLGLRSEGTPIRADWRRHDLEGIVGSSQRVDGESLVREPWQ